MSFTRTIHKIRRPNAKQHQGSQRVGVHQIGYRRWRKVRRLYLQEHPLCVECNTHGITGGATEVDHIIPIANGCDPWDEDNFQALCKTHHSAKTARENALWKKSRG